MALTDEKYLSFTTFTKDGTAKPTPVWIVDLGDGTMGFTTFSTSWKVKRLKNNSAVTLQPCDAKGTVTDGSEAVSATAVAHQGSHFERVAKLVKAKYGIQYTMITGFGKIRKMMGKDSGTDTGIVITLD